MSRLLEAAPRALRVTTARFAPTPTQRSTVCEGGTRPDAGSRRHRGKIGARFRIDCDGPAGRTGGSGPRSQVHRTHVSALHSALSPSGDATGLSRAGLFRSSLTPNSAAPVKLPRRVASRVDVKHVTVWGAPVPGILDLKLHLSFLHSAVAHRAGRTDSRPSPQSVGWAIRDRALFNGLAGFVAQDALVRHLALRVGGTVKPHAASSDAGVCQPGVPVGGPCTLHPLRVEK